MLIGVKKLRHDGNLSSILQFIERTSFCPNPLPDVKSISLDTLPQEYPQYGTSDFRHPAYQVRLEDGSRITELQYTGHRIIDGKPELEGLPAVYAESDREAQTLELELTDAYTGLTVILSYTVFEDFSAVARSTRFVHKGKQPVRLARALSATVDFPDADYEFLYLSGAWARERHVQRRPLGPGGTRIESRRGSSSHQLNPFAALLRPNADEDQGEVYGFSLVYSGSFLMEAEVDQFDSTRLSVGINPFDFFLAACSRRKLSNPGSGARVLPGRTRWNVEDLSPFVPHPIVQRHSPGPRAAYPGQQLGGDLFSIQCGKNRSDREGRGGFGH